MKNFIFFNPTKLVFGKDAINSIGDEISNLFLKRILILYGMGTTKKLGITDKIKNILESKKIECFEFGGIKPNPVLSKVYECISYARELEVDAIIAVGGGSVIDTAKVVACGYYYNGDIWEVFEGKNTVKNALPIIAVSTIPGTGSEMNPWAVITKEDEKKKWPFPYSPFSFPKISFVDPQLHFTLPKNLTINGIIDAICHTLEFYFDGTPNTEIQDEFTETIIRTLIRNCEIVLENPYDYESRAKIALSSILAFNGLLSIGRSRGDWASHAIEHSLSALYDIPHGLGLAIVFPAWMKYVKSFNIPKFERFATKIFNISSGTSDYKSEKGIEELKVYFRKIGAPVTLKEIGINISDLDNIVENVSLRGIIGNLKKLTKEDIRKILEYAYE